MGRAAALRRDFADEDDPTPPDFVTPPQRSFHEDDDPDELLGVLHAYAGQVTAIDRALGSFLDALDQLNQDALFV